MLVYLINDFIKYWNELDIVKRQEILKGCNLPEELINKNAHKLKYSQYERIVYWLTLPRN